MQLNIRQSIIDTWKKQGYVFDIEADTHIMFTTDNILKYEETISSPRVIRFYKGEEVVYVGLSNGFTLKGVGSDLDLLEIFYEV